MNLIEYTRYGGFELAELVRGKQITPKELSQLFIQVVKKANSQINSVVEVYDDALEIAAQSNPQAPFGGVPFLRKDLGATEADRLQELGSRLFRNMICC